MFQICFSNSSRVMQAKFARYQVLTQDKKNK